MSRAVKGRRVCTLGRYSGKSALTQISANTYTGGMQVLRLVRVETAIVAVYC